MTFRRDALLASTARRWIIHRAFGGTTSVPLQLRPSEGPACQVRGAVSEGPACRVRFGGTRLSRPLRDVGAFIPLL